MEYIYEVSNLDFMYTQNHIIKDMSLKIKKGSFTGILGPNGCGKSTLLKNMIKYLEFSSGDIKLNNKSIIEIEQKNIAKTVGFIPQKSELKMNITVNDMIMMGRFPHLKSKWSGYSKEDREIADKIIAELNLEKYIERTVFSLSGGEFQRVLLARALVQEPEILILDEATSNLDINYAAELMTLVKKLTLKKEITAIAVLHDLNLASTYCTEIALLKDGKVRYFDKPNKLFKKEILKDIYDIEPKILEDNYGNYYVVPEYNLHWIN